jgi:hypothetical protein
VDYRKCFNNSALSSTAKRFSPTTRQIDLTEECFEGELVQSRPNSIIKPAAPVLLWSSEASVGAAPVEWMLGLLFTRRALF